MIDVTTREWFAGIKDRGQSVVDALLNYINELEEENDELRDKNEELTEMLTDVPRRYIERLRDDV